MTVYCLIEYSQDEIYDDYSIYNLGIFESVKNAEEYLRSKHPEISIVNSCDWPDVLEGFVDEETCTYCGSNNGSFYYIEAYELNTTFERPWSF